MRRFELAAGVVRHNGRALGTDGIGSLLDRPVLVRKQGGQRKPYHLHRRAAQVLRLIALGHTYQQTAHILGMSAPCAEQYIARFKARWAPGAPLTVLVGIALREGIVSPHELISNAERYLKLDA